MAISTAASHVRHIDTGVFTFYGYRVPENVFTFSVLRQIDTDSDLVAWGCRSGSAHSMTIRHPVDTDQIIAVLTAMRMSC